MQNLVNYSILGSLYEEDKAMGLGRCSKCGESRSISSELCPHCGSTSQVQMSKRIYERCPVCKGMGIKSIPDDQESSDDEVNNLCRACMGQKGYWVDIWE